jgi:type I restriction enzyme S subunit
MKTHGRFRPYPKYKPAGVAWLGYVPEGWDVMRIKYRTTTNDEVLPENTDPNYEMEYIDISSVDSASGIASCTVVTFEDAPSRARRIVRNNDVIISTVRTYLRAIASIKNPKPNTIVSTGFAVIRAKDIEAKYLAFALREPGLINEIVARSVGVSYPAINASEIGCLPIPIPKEDEQRTIADFLDRETARIDALVDKNRRLIERLKEKRSALISRTVTRGLPLEEARAAGFDPNPKLKDSGVEWLGPIPKEWGIQPLMHLTDQSRMIMYGIVLPGPDVEDGVLIVKGGDIKPGNLRPENLCRTTREIERNYARSRLKAGDIVFSIRGTVGEAELVPQAIEGANLTQDAARVAAREGVDSRWLLYSLKSLAVIDALLSLSLGAAVRGVNIRDLKRVSIPLPATQNEQHAIANYLDRETAKIDALVAKVETAIERLKEYRSALISAAVTGKIDLRGATK